MDRSNQTHLLRVVLPLKSVALPPSQRQEPSGGIKVAPNNYEAQ
jgi:hypothetical protein